MKCCYLFLKDEIRKMFPKLQKKKPNTNNLLFTQNTRKKQGSLEFAGNLWQEMDKTPSTPALSNKNECLPIRLNAAFL